MVINEWPGEKGSTEDKVPTTLAYAAENIEKNLDKNKWGYEVRVGWTTYAWWKLLLDKTTKKTDFDDPLLEKAIGTRLLRLPEGKSAMEVMTDFLTPVQEYFMGKLRDAMLETALEQTPFRYVVTVPATWQHSARDETRRAVKEAGFARGDRDEIIVIDEPEAAALSVIRSMQYSPSASALKVYVLV